MANDRDILYVVKDLFMKGIEEYISMVERLPKEDRYNEVFKFGRVSIDYFKEKESYLLRLYGEWEDFLASLGISIILIDNSICASQNGFYLTIDGLYRIRTILQRTSLNRIDNYLKSTSNKAINKAIVKVQSVAKRGVTIENAVIRALS